MPRSRPHNRMPIETREKVIVSGSRSFADYKLMCDRLDQYLSQIGDPVLLNGDAPGADKLAQKYAFDNWLDIMIFPADWDKHGKAAGPIRNEEMAKVGEYLIAFWDGKSPGTADMIQRAKKRKLIVRVVRF